MCPYFIQNLYHEWMLDFVKSWSFVLSFSIFVWWDIYMYVCIYIDSCLFNHLCIFVMKPNWSWWIIFSNLFCKYVIENVCICVHQKYWHRLLFLLSLCLLLNCWHLRENWKSFIFWWLLLLSKALMCTIKLLLWGHF